MYGITETVHSGAEAGAPRGAPVRLRPIWGLGLARGQLRGFEGGVYRNNQCGSVWLLLVCQEIKNPSIKRGQVGVRGTESVGQVKIIE